MDVVDPSFLVKAYVIGSPPPVDQPGLASMPLSKSKTGWNGTTKDVVPWEPLGKEKACPKPGAAHSAPFQPSPYESVISRVHVAPASTASGTLEVYGAPPLRVVPSEQPRLQPTSVGHHPLEQVITEDMDGSTPEPGPSSSPEPDPSSMGDGGGGLGDGGGEEGDGGGGDGEGGGGEGEGGDGLGEGGGGGGEGLKPYETLRNV